MKSERKKGLEEGEFTIIIAEEKFYSMKNIKRICLLMVPFGLGLKLTQKFILPEEGERAVEIMFVFLTVYFGGFIIFYIRYYPYFFYKLDLVQKSDFLVYDPKFY